MADLVKKIRTESGDLQIDYNALANLPKYAASSYAGGAATSANKLNTNAGSTTKPVYFANGVPVEIGYTIAKSVPSDAKFTDTTYTLSSFGITATAAELNYCDGVTSNIQTQLNGKAASSHNHAASNITSGTLAVARGGTGVTANPSMLTNLGSTSAASVFAASPRPGVTGTLPIANGGTGATTAAAARTNLGVVTPNDYVVEQGKSGNTYYRKWNSGIMEQWYAVTTSNQAINNPYGSIYYGQHTWTFPVAFTDIDVVCCSCFRWGTGVSWGGSLGPTTKSVVLCGYDLYSRAAGGDTCHINAYAKGRWK